MVGVLPVVSNWAAAPPATSSARACLLRYTCGDSWAQHGVPPRTWSDPEPLEGGTGMVGSGETQLEADRRPIRDKIRYLKQQLRGCGGIAAEGPTADVVERCSEAAPHTTGIGV